MKMCIDVCVGCDRDCDGIVHLILNLFLLYNKDECSLLYNYLLEEFAICTQEESVIKLCLILSGFSFSS